ncbi:hypothetical protein [Streptomyces sp. NPDC048277]|uniref:hypothetical protein n=1 Tax=Streptomyces sp. NPDC048277 TaxID=3155027 RepID=UPI0033C3A7C1
MGEREVGAATGTHNSVSGNAVINGPVVMAGRVESLSMTLAPPTVTPHQMPPAIASFVNRTVELDRLRKIADALRESHLPGVIVLSGLGGVGKTQLVAQWVARALTPSSSYPGGQLYVDLEEGRRDGAGDVSGALAGFLRALGVHREFMPADLGERTALFRSVTAERDTLVVVDNARQAAEVRPLVPSTGLLVVTSRTGLPALAVDGAVAIALEPLDERSGMELVRRWRVADADSAAKALVHLCNGLPLALRAVGEWLAKRPQLSLTDAVRALGADGLPPSEDGATSVKAVLDMAYQGLPDHAKRLYRLIGCLPGTTVTGGLAVTVGVPTVEDAVGELLTAHLMAVVQSPDRPRRFRPHDVVREHTRRMAVTLPETERRAILRAVTSFYTDAAAHADVLVLGAGRFRLQMPPTRSLDELSPGEWLFTDGAEALEWLDAERGNLLALLRAAADERRDDAVWQLCESLWALFDGRKHHLDSIEAHGLGIEAARRCGRADAEVRMRNQLARAHYGLGAFDEARRTLELAEPLLDGVADARLSGMIRETQGLIALASGAPEDAYALFGQALDANSATQDAHGVVVQSYNIGQALVAAGRPGEALDVLSEARATAADSGDHGMLPRIDIIQARALQRLNRPEAASEAAIRAAEQANERKQYAKLDNALGILSELAASTSNTRLRAACEAKLRELYRGVGVTPEGGGADPVDRGA